MLMKRRQKISRPPRLDDTSSGNGSKRVEKVNPLKKRSGILGLQKSATPENI